MSWICTLFFCVFICLSLSRLSAKKKNVFAKQQFYYWKNAITECFIENYLSFTQTLWAANLNSFFFFTFSGQLLSGLNCSKCIMDSNLFHIYWDFRIKFYCVKKRFGFYCDQSERRNEFLTREKIVSSNHKPQLKRIVFSRASSQSSPVPLSGSFDKIIFSAYSSCS